MFEMFIRSNLFSYSFYRNLFVPIFASLLMALVVYSIQSWHLIMIVLISGSVYALALLPWIWKRELKGLSFSKDLFKFD